MTNEQIKELEKAVYERKTTYPEGFTGDEVDAIFKEYPKLNTAKADSCLTGITGIMKDGQFITYHCDVFKALQCGLENRDLKEWEWD